MPPPGRSPAQPRYVHGGYEQDDSSSSSLGRGDELNEFDESTRSVEGITSFDSFSSYPRGWGFGVIGVDLMSRFVRLPTLLVSVIDRYAPVATACLFNSERAVALRLLLNTA